MMTLDRLEDIEEWVTKIGNLRRQIEALKDFKANQSIELVQLYARDGDTDAPIFTLPTSETVGDQIIDATIDALDAELKVVVSNFKSTTVDLE
jgi:hypothetical protein